jgi:hypothetical protein
MDDLKNELAALEARFAELQAESARLQTEMELVRNEINGIVVPKPLIEGFDAVPAPERQQ